MQKNDAIKKIYNVANQRAASDFSHSEFMKRKLREILGYTFQGDNISQFELVEFNMQRNQNKYKSQAQSVHRQK